MVFLEKSREFRGEYNCDQEMIAFNYICNIMFTRDKLELFNDIIIIDCKMRMYR